MAHYSPKTVKLKPKNAKAGGVIARANTAEWVIVDTADQVVFSDREGPWLKIRPNRTNDSIEFTIWVHATQDRNYQVMQE